MKAIFDHREDIVQNVKTFWFRTELPMRFVAGQFTELYLPHAPADERGIRRWFTISSSPDEPLIGLTTKFSTAQSSSFKQALLNLTPGAEVNLAEPMGDFVLPKDPRIPLVFVAGGMGITPVHSMIRWLYGRDETRPIHLIYAVTDPEELAFTELFTSYACNFMPMIKRAPAGFTGLSGSLSVPRIKELADLSDDRSLLYISGPEPMVESFFKILNADGFGQERLITDYFPGYRQF